MRQGTKALPQERLDGQWGKKYVEDFELKTTKAVRELHARGMTYDCNGEADDAKRLSSRERSCAGHVDGRGRKGTAKSLVPVSIRILYLPLKFPEAA